MPIPIGGGPIIATYTIQADLSGTAYGGSPTWTDITDQVLTTGSGQPIQITFGRQDEASDISPSQCAFTLINDDGRFTPGNASSPYYPNVLPGVRVRVSESVGGSTYYRFDGYVDSWETVSSPGTREALCAVAATDILARMGTDQPLGTPLLELMTADSPTALYSLTEDDSSSTITGDTSGHGHANLNLATAKAGPGSYDLASVTTTVSFGAETLLLNSALTSASGDDLKGYFFTGPAPVLSGTATHEVVFEVDANLVPAMLRHSGGGGALAVPLAVYVRGGQVLGGVGLWHDGSALRVAWMAQDNAGNVTYNFNSTKDVNDGAVHHALISLGTSPDFEIYVDGIPQGGMGTLAMPSTAGATLCVGATANAYYSNSTPPFRGSIGYLGIYSTVLSSARASAHSSAAHSGSIGESTDAHIADLLAYRTNTGSSLDTGDGTVGLHDIRGVTLQQALVDTAKAEGGLVYVDGQGRVVFRRRSAQYNTTSSFTLDANASAVAIGTTFRVDTQDVVNDVTISRPLGADQRIVDATSEAAYGVRAVSDTLILNSDNDSRDAAGWRVAQNKTPKTRSPSAVVDLATETSTATAQAVLAAVPWTRMTMASLPANAPASSVDGFIQGWTESIGVDEWTVSFYTTPMPPGTLRADAAPSANTKLDNGLVIAW